MPKKQPKKRTWKKADIKDVEDALEDERLIDKMKGKSIAGKERVDEAGDLFTIDTEGSQTHLSNKTRREIARAKLFPAKKANIGLSASEEMKIARAGDRAESAKSMPSSYTKVDYHGHKQAVQAVENIFDLWTTPAEPLKPKFHCPPPKQAPKTLHQKVSAAPAVLPAHEGQSMNPQTESYEELLCTAAARQLEAEREDEALERKMRPVTFELRELVGAEALKKMSEEEKTKLYHELVGKRIAEAEEEGDVDGAGNLSKAARLRIKSQALRNKRKTRKEANTRQAQAKAQRKLEKSVGDLGSIQKEIKEDLEMQKQRRDYKLENRRKRKELEEKEGVVPKTRRLGRTKFQEEALVIPDTEAAAKGLRAMPLKTNAVKDRMSSIVRRGMLPAPIEATRGAVVRGRKKNNKVKNGRKYISPLMRDNLLSR